MNCSKCKKKMILPQAWLGGKPICQKCWDKRKIKRANPQDFWDKYLNNVK